MNLRGWEENATRARRLGPARWSLSREPLVLLACLRCRGRVTRTKDGRRRSRLFACACARRHWDLMAEAPRAKVTVLREGVETAERFADGGMGRAAFEAAVARARVEGRGIGTRECAATFMAGRAVWPGAF